MKLSQVSHPHGAVAASGMANLDAAWLHVAIQPGMGLSLCPSPALVTSCRMVVASDHRLEPVDQT